MGGQFGMRTKSVIVLPYDRAWKSDFEAIKQEIASAIGDWIVGIEHVGSTAVEGMSAKPCIDIDVSSRITRGLMLLLKS